MRLSQFERQHAARVRVDDTCAGSTRLSALNPSLVQDLLRFDTGRESGGGLDLLEVLAAALRHSRALLLHLQFEYRVIAIVVRPIEREVQGPLPVEQLLELRLPELRVLRVEPAPPTAATAPLAGDSLACVSPLPPLLWELALRGARAALLPEIAGIAAYRVPPMASLPALDPRGSLAAAVARLRKQTTPLREIAAWPGFDAERAVRLLNALYLQASLMVIRAHPAALEAR